MQDEGWPLGLQPLSLRAGLVMMRRNRDHLGGSFNTTLLSDSSAPSSTTLSSSSALDTEVQSTLGSPIGGTEIVNMSSSRRRSTNEEEEEKEVHQVAVVKKWEWRRCFSFSLCPTISRTDASEASIVPSSASLAHFLAVERRRAAAKNRRIKIRSRRGGRVQIPVIDYAPDEYEYDVHYAQDDDDHVEEPNSLFTNGHIAPPPPKLREWKQQFGG